MRIRFLIAAVVLAAALFAPFAAVEAATEESWETPGSARAPFRSGCGAAASARPGAVPFSASGAWLSAFRAAGAACRVRRPPPARFRAGVPDHACGMTYKICVRIRPHRRRQDRVIEHADGRRPPDNPDGSPGRWVKRDGWPCTEVVPCVGQSAIDEGRAALARDRRRKKRPGRPGEEMIDVVITGPPEFIGPDAWKREDIRKWADAGVKKLAQLAAPPGGCSRSTP